jgi:hypothetical protein
MQMELVTREPIFEKCPHLRIFEKRGSADRNLAYSLFGICCPVHAYSSTKFSTVGTAAEPLPARVDCSNKFSTWCTQLYTAVLLS